MFRVSQALSLCVCALEPAIAEPDRALSHRAESKPSRLPDPAAGGAARPTHTYTCTLLQEKTSPWRQHHPQQVSSAHYSKVKLVSVSVLFDASVTGYFLTTTPLQHSLCSDIFADTLPFVGGFQTF